MHFSSENPRDNMDDVPSEDKMIKAHVYHNIIVRYSVITRGQVVITGTRE